MKNITEHERHLGLGFNLGYQCAYAFVTCVWLR